MTTPDPVSTTAQRSPRRKSLKVAPPTFEQPEPSEPIPPQNPPAPPEPETADAGFDDAPDDPILPQNAKTPGSSQGSFASRSKITEAIREGIYAAGGRMNDLTRDELARANGAWIPDEQDAEGLADPIAGIVSRRGELGAVANPDLADAIRGLIALAVYAFKQLNLRAHVRRLRRELGEPAFPPPAAEAPGDAE